MNRKRRLVAGVLLVVSAPLVTSTIVWADQAIVAPKVAVHHRSHDKVCSWGPQFEQRLTSRSTKLEARLARLTAARDAAETAGHHQKAAELGRQAAQTKTRLASLTSRAARVDAARTKAGCPPAV